MSSEEKQQNGQAVTLLGFRERCLILYVGDIYQLSASLIFKHIWQSMLIDISQFYSTLHPGEATEWYTVDYGILRAANDLLIVSSKSIYKKATFSLPYSQEPLTCQISQSRKVDSGSRHRSALLCLVFSGHYMFLLAISCVGPLYYKSNIFPSSK